MTGYNMEKGYEDDINHSGIVDIRPLNTDTERYYYFYTQERHSEEENQVLCIGTLKNRNDIVRYMKRIIFIIYIGLT